MSKEKPVDPADSNSGSSNAKADDDKSKEIGGKESCETCGTEVVSWKADKNSGIRLVIR